MSLARSGMPGRSAMVVMVDGLAAPRLGPYGSPLFDTPALNRLAAESLLFESLFADAARLDVAYRSLWQGAHALCETPKAPSLAALAASLRCEPTLLADSAEVAALPAAADFSDRIVAAWEGEAPAESLADTQAASLFATAIDLFDNLSPPFFLWIHSQGLFGPWDAPREMRQEWLEEAAAPDWLAPPPRPAAGGAAELWRESLRGAYAAQAQVFDDCLQALLEEFAERSWASETLLLFASPRGYALGEHASVAIAEGPLFSEHLHLPCLARLPTGELAGQRCGAMIQPPDLYALLADWLGAAVSPSQAWGRNALDAARSEPHHPPGWACAGDGDRRAIRTPAWMMTWPAASPEGAGEAPAGQLYFKPDDRWEANEVSRRQPEIGEALERAWQGFADCARRMERDSLPPLPDELISTDV